jgi:hypothetical protein
MIMRRRVLSAIGLIGLLLCGCTVGSRRLITEDTEVGSFDKVYFSTIGELTVRQGDRESLTIEAESNVIRRITAEVKDETLYIDMRSVFPWWGVVPTKPIKYDLTVRDLAALDLSGVGGIYAGAIDTDRLDLNISGAGEIIIRALNAETLVVEHSGVGKCELAGEVIRQEIMLSGAGECEAADLESETADVEVTGVGKATVWAKERLDISLSGAGSVGYYGDPTVTQNVSGVGRVRSLGSR